MSRRGEPEGLTPPAEVLAEVLAAIRPLPPGDVDLPHVGGHVLAEDIRAGFSLPTFANAAMDGYAVRATDTSEASETSPVRLPLRGASYAGRTTPGLLEPRTASVITTGAPLPEHADAVVRLEDALSNAETLTVTCPVPPGADVRLRGEDIGQGDPVLHAGQVLGPGQIAAAAALGLDHLRAYPPLRVAVLPTGDEIQGLSFGGKVHEGLPAGGPTPPPFGKVFDAAGPAICALLWELGVRLPEPGPTVGDDPNRIAETLRWAASESDAVISIGGVSVGERDFLAGAAATLGEVRTWRVAVRPAKPFVFGVIQGKPLFGLPGNPTSALVAFELFVRPALLAMMGRRPDHRRTLRAELVEAVHDESGVEHWMRAVCWTEDERRLVRPLGRGRAGSFSSLAQANAWLIIPADVRDAPAGSAVNARSMWGALD